MSTHLRDNLPEMAVENICTSIDSLYNEHLPQLLENARRAGMVEVRDDAKEVIKVAFQNRTSSLSHSHKSEGEEVYRLAILSAKGIPTPNHASTAFVFEVGRTAHRGVGLVYRYGVHGLLPNEEELKSLGAAEIAHTDLGNGKSLKIIETFLSSFYRALKNRVDEAPLKEDTREAELVLPSALEVARVAGTPIKITGGFAGGDLRLIQERIAHAVSQGVEKESAPDILDFTQLLQFYLLDPENLLYHLSQMSSDEVARVFYSIVSVSIDKNLTLLKKIRKNGFETGYPKRPRRATVTVENDGTVMVDTREKWLQINGKNIDKVLYSFERKDDFRTAYSVVALCDSDRGAAGPLLQASYDDGGALNRPEMLKVAAFLLLLRDGLVNDVKLGQSPPRPLGSI